MKDKILLIGGGGHCRSVLDTLLEQTGNEMIAVADDFLTPGTIVMGVPVIGNCFDLEKYRLQGYNLGFVAVGSVGRPRLRIDFYNRLEEAGFEQPNIIDKTAAVSKYTSLGKGIFVGKNSVVNAGATVGNCAIINTSVVVEHDCRLGDFVHLSSGTVLSGGVIVGDRTHIGANSVIRQELSIGSDTIIGMGSVVAKSMPEGVTAFGSPCKIANKEDLFS
ncbi:MAG: acetyltransferase [Acutalibacteraceae bacterium]|jgi:sugar O-acyltransferase (sialic acid O-acetyltransferase NeuD family)